MLEIKKMIALQSIQQIDDLNNLNNSYSCYGKQNTSIPYSEMNYDKEKKARDQVTYSQIQLDKLSRINNYLIVCSSLIFATN